MRESVLKSTTAGFANAPVLIQYENVCDRRFQGTLTQPSGQFLSEERYTERNGGSLNTDDRAITILGIDPGTRITGYGLIRLKGSTLEALDFGCVRPPPQLPLPERYRIIFEGIEQLIDRYCPQAVAVESQFVLKNVASALKLGMAKGMAILAAARRNIAVHEYSPSEAKKAVVGNGAASKPQVQRMIASLLRLSKLPEPEDAADALALAICHAHNWRNSTEPKLCKRSNHV